MPRIAVVGGGILGASTAAHLARRGVEITLLTEGDLGDGASGRSLSWLNSSGPYSPAYRRLRLLGLARYRALAPAPWLRLDGGLRWGAGGDRAAVERLRGCGYPVEWLARANVPSRVPGVDVRAVPAEGAVLAPGEGWVELRPLIGRLGAEVVAHGGRVLTRVGRCAVEAAGRGVTGVRTAGGDRLAADAVVLATGAAVPAALAEFGVAVPDATSAGLLVRTRPAGTRLRAVLTTPRVSVRPAPGGGLALDAAWSEQRVVVRPDGTHEVPAGTVEGLLREAAAVLADAPALAVESVGVGPKPVPGDGEALGAPEPLLAPFRPERFSAGRTAPPSG